MKTLVLGDIHGRNIWKDIINKENPDRVIFLGDYVSTHENITAKEQIDNMKEIFDYKDEHPQTILLRGNHDLQHLGYYWAECSGFFREVEKLMIPMREDYLDRTQWIHIEGNTVFSHAGISEVWLKETRKPLEEINGMEPSELFGFLPDHFSDVYGDSPTQPCTWIRPTTLVSCAIKGYDQVVGHTSLKECTNVKELAKLDFNLWLCDALGFGSYLVIEDGVYSENKIEKS